jgi:hypothetical protein
LAEDGPHRSTGCRSRRHKHERTCPTVWRKGQQNCRERL